MCRNFYQLEAEAIWERVLTLPTEEQTLDFRYIERGTVALALETDRRILVCPDVNNPTYWYEVLNITRVPEIVGIPNAEAIEFQSLGLMTLVQSSNHLGVFVSLGVPGAGTRFFYLFSENFGGSWQSSLITGHGHYMKRLYSALNTAGTGEIIIYTSTSIFGHPTEVFRSVNKGYTWQWIGDLTIDGLGRTAAYVPFRTRKPWQYGVSGTVVYGTMYGFWTDVTFMKSTNRGVSFTSSLGFGATALGLEVWTFDPLRVGVLQARGDQQMTFHLSTDGGATWVQRPTGLVSGSPPTFLQVLHGNPANKREWGYVLHGYLHNVSGRKFINISLDDGVTWYDRTGNLVLLEPSGYDGRDYLITPPFRRGE